MTVMGSNVASRAKIGSLILGAVVLGLGLYSHYTSAWIKTIYLDEELSYRLYELCPILDGIFEYYTFSCPDIAMERYFVGAIIACFVLSVIFFGLGFVKNDKSETIMRFDVGYHVLGGLALLAAGIIYMVSAMQIYYDFDDEEDVDYDDDNDLNEGDLHFRYLEKRIAASLTIIQGALLLTIARLIVRNTPRGATSGTRVVVAQPVVAQPNYVVDASVSYPQQSVGYIVPPPPYQQNAPPYAAVPAPQYAYPQQTNYGVPPTATAPPVGANQGAPSYGFTYTSGDTAHFGNGK